MSYGRRVARRTTRRAGRTTARAGIGLVRAAATQVDRGHRARYVEWARRIRCSWWARWVVPAYAFATLHGIVEGHSTAAWLLTLAVIGGVIFHPGWRNRATHGMNMRPKAKKARRGWKLWAQSRYARTMYTTAHPAHALLTGERMHPPRIKRFDTENNDETFIVVAESPAGLTEEKWARCVPLIAQYLNMPVPTYELDRDNQEVKLRFSGDGGQRKIPSFSEDVPEKLPNLKALPVARGVDGSHACLPFSGGHTLLIGATGSGKGSVFWSVLRCLAPGIRDGFVQVWAVDPKGGVELTPGRPLFHRYKVGIDGEEQGPFVEFLEDLVSTMKARLKKMQDSGQRLHKVTRREPLIVLLFDEFLMLQYGMDGAQKRTATVLLKALLSQGRAAQVVVVGAAQMGQKTEIGSIRELFPYRICLRTSEPNQVNLVLGDGALERGAEAHKIPRNAPGTGYLMEDGGYPMLVRFPWASDDFVKAMARDYAPGTATKTAAPTAPGAAPAGPQDVIPADAATTAGNPAAAAETPVDVAAATLQGKQKNEKRLRIEAELDRLEAAHIEPVPSVVALSVGCTQQYVGKVIRERREAAAARASSETGGETRVETHLETGPPDRNKVPMGDPISPVKSSQAEQEIEVLGELWRMPAYGEATWPDMNAADQHWRDITGQGGGTA